MVYPKKDMLLMKKRSDPTTSKYAECTDDGNVYVHVDTAGAPVIVEGEIDVGNFPTTQTVNGTVNVGNFPLTQVTIPSGITDTRTVQSINTLLSGYKMIPAGTSAGYSISNFYTKPITVYGKSFLFYIVNPLDTALSVYFKNTWTTALGTASTAKVASITVPAAPFNPYTSTSWSSCFTDIGGVLNDESLDMSDAGTSDVPFPFTAVNDAIYFGASAPFNATSLVVGTAGVYNASGVWEYWNGSTWSTLTVASEFPSGSKSTPFKVSGGVYYAWSFPSDWMIYDIPGSPIANYWIRFRITSFTSITTAPSLNNGTYQLASGSISHGFAIDNLYANGDLNIVIKTDATSSLLFDVPLFWQLREI